MTKKAKIVIAVIVALLIIGYFTNWFGLAKPKKLARGGNPDMPPAHPVQPINPVRPFIPIRPVDITTCPPGYHFANGGCVVDGGGGSGCELVQGMTGADMGYTLRRLRAKGFTKDDWKDINTAFWKPEYVKAVDASGITQQEWKHGKDLGYKVDDFFVAYKTGTLAELRKSVSDGTSATTYHTTVKSSKSNEARVKHDEGGDKGGAWGTGGGQPHGGY